MRGSNRVLCLSVAIFAICFNLAASYGRTYSSESSSGADYSTGYYGPQSYGSPSFQPREKYGASYGPIGDHGPYPQEAKHIPKRPIKNDRYPVDPYPAGPDPYPAGPDPYPAGPGPYPAGPGPYPTGPDSYPAGPDPYPSGPDPYPAGPGPYPTGPDHYPAGPDPYAAGPDPYPTGSYPKPKGSHSADPYPDVPGPYPMGPGPYPDGPGHFPAGSGPYPPVEPYPPKAHKPNHGGNGRGSYQNPKPYPGPHHSKPGPAPYEPEPYPQPKPSKPYPKPHPAPVPAKPYPYTPSGPYPQPPVVPKTYPPVEPYPHPPVGYKPDPYPKHLAPYPATPSHHSGPNGNNPYPQAAVKPKHHKPSLPSSLCDNCQFKNGVGFNPFPKSCQAYVTCQKHGGYKLIPTKMNCPYNLFWSQKLLTCVRPKNTKCPFDPCQAGKAGSTVPVYGNCAAYHVCDSYRHTGAIFCCAYGYRYQQSYGYNKPGYQPCVKDHSCRDSCAPKKTVGKKEPCRLRAVRGAITKYQELVHGKYIVRYCAPGSGFVQKNCGCTARVKVAHKTGCNAEVYIDFKYGIRDVSGNYISVGNEWNRVKSVKAPGAKDGFAGEFYNGQLILWRFANAPLGPPLKIAFTFLEKAYKKGGYGGKNEILVSNGDCGKPASVSITFDRASQTVTALVDTKHTYGKNYQPAYVSVPYAAGEYKEVHYEYDGKYLTLKVNSKSSQKSKSVAVYGDVQVRHCALSIGGVKGATPFYGLLDDFKLFLCAPKPVHPYPTKGPYPVGPGPYPAGPGPYPAGPGPYPAGPGPYPAGPGPYPTGPGPYPVGPGPYPGKPYHDGPPSYPPKQAGHYPAPYPAKPNANYPPISPKLDGHGTYPPVSGQYPAGPGAHNGGSDPYPAPSTSYPPKPQSYRW